MQLGDLRTAALSYKVVTKKYRDSPFVSEANSRLEYIERKLAETK